MKLLCSADAGVTDLVDPVSGADGAAEGAAAHGAERALDGQRAALQVALGPHHLPPRRPDLVLRQPCRQQLLFVLPARPAQPLPCAKNTSQAGPLPNLTACCLAAFCVHPYVKQPLDAKCLMLASVCKATLQVERLHWVTRVQCTDMCTFCSNPVGTRKLWRRHPDEQA